jgi:uncharacterized oxidoreductase
MQLSNNKILITGGASGIGLGLTKRFVDEGNAVIVCGRRQDVLDEAVGKVSNVISWQGDLSQNTEQERLYNWVAENHPDLNVLINNAGIQNWMNATDDDFSERADQEIAINVITPIHLTALFLKLKSLNTIMNVTSGLAFAPISKAPVYCATKAFLRSFTLSLRHQLRNSGVEVIEIIPPALNTDLGGKGLHDAAPPVSDFIESIFEQLKNGSDELSFGMSEGRVKANNETIGEYFRMMNPA